VDVRIAHPVPLAVENVVAQFHVLEDLGHAQEGCSGDPGGLVLADQQRSPPGNLQTPLDLDHAPDVRSIGRSAFAQDVVADGIEFTTQFGHLLITQVRGGRWTHCGAARLSKGAGPRLEPDGGGWAFG